MRKFRFPGIIALIVLCIVPMMGYAQSDEDPFVVGLLLFDVPTFIQEMETLGYVQGENIEYLMLSYETMTPENFMDEYNRQLQEIMTAELDVLVVQTDTDSVTVREQSNAPIVFSISDNPIATGAINDLTTPGVNVTGVVSNQHHTRRLQLLKEINPATDVVYYLYSAFALEGEQVLNDVQALAEELNIEIVAAPVADAATGIEALNNLPEGADWLFLTPFLPFDLPFTEALLTVSMANKVPIAGFVAQPTVGYLLNYGPAFDDTARQSARMTDQILRGANAAELPVMVAENVLILNLEAAEALGMEFPAAVLRQANLIMRPGDFEPTPMPEMSNSN